MVKIYQFIKKVNETEVGATGTNETYLLVPKSVDVTDIFKKTNEIYKFKDKVSLQEYDIRYTIGREQRIVGLGPYYRDNDISAGDRILIEHIRCEDKELYNIDSIKMEDSMILQVSSSKGIRILNSDENKLEFKNNKKTYHLGKKSNIELKYKGNFKPRKDSKVALEYYDLLIGGRNINKSFSDKDILEIVFVDNDMCYIIEDISYQKIYIEEM